MSQRKGVHPEAGEHVTCTEPALCDCDCRQCKRAWENAGRPSPPGGPKSNGPPRLVPEITAELVAASYENALTPLVRGSRDLASMAARFIQMDPAFAKSHASFLRILTQYVEMCDRVLPEEKP